MQIYPAAERPAQDVDPQYFTGEVSMQPLVTAPAPARLRGVSVSITLTFYQGDGFRQRAAVTRENCLSCWR